MTKRNYDPDVCEDCGGAIPPGEIEVRYPTGAAIDSLFLCSDCADAFDEQEEQEEEEAAERLAEYEEEMRLIYEAIDEEEWFRYHVVGMTADEQF